MNMFLLNVCCFVFQIIVMSATMDVDHFSKYFNNAPVLYVEGRQFPVQVRLQNISYNAAVLSHIIHGLRLLFSFFVFTGTSSSGLVALMGTVLSSMSVTPRKGRFGQGSTFAGVEFCLAMP